MKYRILKLLCITSYFYLSGEVMAQRLDVNNTKEAKVAEATKKAEQIIIPKILLEDMMTLGDAIAFLRIRSRELDPLKKGIDFIIGTKVLANVKMKRLLLENVSLATVIKFITQLTKTRAVAIGNIILITDKKVILTNPYEQTTKGKVLKPGVKRLKNIIEPRLFVEEGTTVESVICFLRLRIRELSADKKPINFVSFGIDKTRKLKYLLYLKNISMFRILQVMALLTDSEIKFTEEAVIISPKKLDNDGLLEKLSNIIIPNFNLAKGSYTKGSMSIIQREINLKIPNNKIKIILGENIDKHIKDNMELQNRSALTLLKLLEIIFNAKLKVLGNEIHFISKTHSRDFLYPKAIAADVDKNNSKMKKNPFLRNKVEEKQSK